MEKNEKIMLYRRVSPVPEKMTKKITGGRLNGLTDIKPQWRIEKLTEEFGICGFGWYYNIIKQWLEDGSNEQKIAFVNIELFVKIDNEWSKPILGIGGSSFIANEKNGLYTSDECYKMALTDAISVACKALGIGADVYIGQGVTKYAEVLEAPKETANKPILTKEHKSYDKIIEALASGNYQINQYKEIFEIPDNIEQQIKIDVEKYGK